MESPYAGMGFGLPSLKERANMFGGAAGIGALAGPIGAAAGIGLEFAGNMMASNAGVSRRTIRRRGLYALDQARSRDALFGGLEEAALLKGQGDERAGFQGARNSLALQNRIAQQGLVQRGAQNRADLEQSFVSRGLLGNSAAVQGLDNQLGSTNAQLAMLDAMHGQQLAQLGLEEGSLLGQQGRERAAMAARRRDFERSIGEGMFGLYTAG